jgi:hypothetical protein
MAEAGATALASYRAARPGGSLMAVVIRHQEHALLGAPPRLFTLVLLASALEVARPHPPIHFTWPTVGPMARATETAVRRPAPARARETEGAGSARSERDALLLMMLVARSRPGFVR